MELGMEARRRRTSGWPGGQDAHLPFASPASTVPMSRARTSSAPQRGQIETAAGPACKTGSTSSPVRIPPPAAIARKMSASSLARSGVAAASTDPTPRGFGSSSNRGLGHGGMRRTPSTAALKDNAGPTAAPPEAVTSDAGFAANRCARACASRPSTAGKQRPSTASSPFLASTFNTSKLESMSTQRKRPGSSTRLTADTFQFDSNLAERLRGRINARLKAARDPQSTALSANKDSRPTSLRRKDSTMWPSPGRAVSSSPSSQRARPSLSPQPPKCEVRAGYSKNRCLPPPPSVPAPTQWALQAACGSTHQATGSASAQANPSQRRSLRSLSPPHSVIVNKSTEPASMVEASEDVPPAGSTPPPSSSNSSSACGHTPHDSSSPAKPGEDELRVCSDIFEEVIRRNSEFGPTLRQVKDVYDAYLRRAQPSESPLGILPAAPGMTPCQAELERENRELRALTARLQSQLNAAERRERHAEDQEQLRPSQHGARQSYTPENASEQHPQALLGTQPSGGAAYCWGGGIHAGRVEIQLAEAATGTAMPGTAAHVWDGGIHAGPSDARQEPCLSRTQSGTHFSTLANPGNALQAWSAHEDVHDLGQLTTQALSAHEEDCGTRARAPHVSLQQGIQLKDDRWARRILERAGCGDVLSSPTTPRSSSWSSSSSRSSEGSSSCRSGTENASAEPSPAFDGLVAPRWGYELCGAGLPVGIAAVPRAATPKKPVLVPRLDLSGLAASVTDDSDGDPGSAGIPDGSRPPDCEESSFTGPDSLMSNVWCTGGDTSPHAELLTHGSRSTVSTRAASTPPCNMGTNSPKYNTVAPPCNMAKILAPSNVQPQMTKLA